ncbi:unnamed protein product [Hydatigera taeniaeformis]|uniref:Trafficking protein particle complex subunit 2-like protein n=1 Tax=Hydatigena taeniaeformis TaxID=6205 RepID=A0A0R3X7C9_HYDTA|nr:unnamed protein product [Hydatigera taeniaeformis]
MFECVAVISSKNTPLFFKTSNPDESLPNQFRVYGSLDIVEEKLSKFSSRSSYGDKETASNYLGLLYPIDDHYVYGYVTNTNIKFILVQEVHFTVNELLKSSSAAQVDNQIKKVFETLHDAYVELVSSPFYVPNTPIDPSASDATKKFDHVVDKILKRSADAIISKFLESASFSEIVYEDVVRDVTVRWEAVIVGSVPQGAARLFTTTYTHIPPLAQETPDDPDLLPSFRDPLRHLRLDVDKRCYRDDVSEVANKVEHRVSEGGPRPYQRLSSVSLPKSDRPHNESGAVSSFSAAKRLTSRSKSTKTSFRKTVRIDLNRFSPRYQLKPQVDDFKDALPGEVILASKLKDYDCHMPLLGVDIEGMRELYTATILRDHVLNRLYHRRNFRNLPPEFKYLRKVNFLEFLKATSWTTMDSEIDRDRHFRLLTTDNSKSVLNEIANHFYECDFAELHVFTNWLDSARADPTLLQLQTCKEITRLCVLIGEELTKSNLGFGETSRMELLIVLATSINNRRLRQCLWSQVRSWLDPLIAGLFSPSKCVREETCYTLAYIFSINSLVEDIRHLLPYDIPYDVTLNVLKAIDMFPETFMTYFLLLGYMLEGCPSFSILNCIMERGAMCTNSLMQKRWPLFVYYAIKHWNAMYLRVDPLYPVLLMEKMTLAAMNPLTRKASKMALVALARKFNRSVGAVTHFNPVWSREED